MQASLSRVIDTMNPQLRLCVAMSFLVMLTAGCLSGDGGGGDSDLATPVAQFSQSETAGTPGTVVAFADESTGSIEGREWDFGALGTSTEANPVITFDEAGVYSVSLTVRGPRGESVMVREDLIEIADVPTAGFSCTPNRGFVPHTITCTDESSDASSFSWNFGDGVTSSRQNPSHIFEEPGSFTVRQRVTSAGGIDVQTMTVEVLPFDIVASVVGGSAPLDVMFTADVGTADGDAAWTIDGQSYLGRTITHRFSMPGTFSVLLVFGNVAENIEDRLIGMKMLEYVVDYGPATADFEPSTSADSGPLTVTLLDRSGGEVDQWVWDFGDGSGCTFPDPNEPGAADPVDVCDAASPTHEYVAVGSYDVSLRIQGPGENEGDAAIEDEITIADAIRVTALDASFEGQATGAELTGGWTTLRPESPTVVASHIALAGAPDAGMPTQGTKWALLDGRGTDGSADVDQVENGIRQAVMPPADQPVLEFDYVLLYAEPPTAGTLDAVTATIENGGSIIEITSARIDATEAYAGSSARFPTEDGSTVRATAVYTASINLAESFPGVSGPELYDLTIRTTNAMNAFRSPRVYVDNLRFTSAAEPITAAFSVDSLPVVAGDPVGFIDETCLDPEADDCVAPTSWRWDFGSKGLASPPESAASAEQDPLYTFPEAGEYEVRMRARVGDQESVATLSLTVLEGPEADFELLTAGPFAAPVSIEFGDLSTADVDDPIVAWSWDFGGWGTSTLATPAPVSIGQAGPVSVRLTITTDSGRTDTAEMMIQVD
ncbi:MAG: PKD domain-containing protein [Myxococcota bacterium]